MNPELIFIPAIMMVALTAIAWTYLFVVRIPSISRNEVDLDKVRSRKLDSLLSDDAQIASQHLLNLFEIPVLFYVLISFLYITAMVSDLMIYCAFGFVFFRLFHTLIHLSYNNVMHRFTAYMLGSLILWFMWGTFALGIILRTM